MIFDFGSCEIPVPGGVFGFETYVVSLLDNHTSVHDFNPCGYVFVAKDGAYNFSSLDLMSFQNRETVPLLLDWALGDMTWEQAMKNQNTTGSYMHVRQLIVCASVQLTDRQDIVANALKVSTKSLPP